MRMRYIKTCAVAATLALGAAMLAGCSSGGDGGGGKPTKITMLVLGDKPTNGRLEKMLAKLNERLTQQTNATLDLSYVEWADWQTQYNVRLLSGDDSIDLITTATDWLYAWDNAQKGAFLPLSEDMLKKDAPKTWAQVDSKGDWDLTKLNGQIQFIPEDNYTQWTNHGFFYRGDWAKAAGFPDGTITKLEDFTKYFAWVKANKPDVQPWDVAGLDNANQLISYMQGHTDLNTIVQYNAGNYNPFQTSKADPTTVTSWFMYGDELEQAAQLDKTWNDMGVWREDAASYDGITRDEFYAGQSALDQHHTQTFVTQIVYNMNQKQPGSDPKFFYFGQENGNIYRDLKTHGAMAVSAHSKNPDKALQVYDLLRNDKEDYMLLNYGIEGSDYVMEADGKLGYPAGYDPATDALGADFWAGRMDEFEPVKVTDAPNKSDIYAALDKVARDYPYTTLIANTDKINSDLAAIGGVLSQYIPQLEFGKFADPGAAIAEMRQKLKEAGWDEAQAAVQADVTAWAKANPPKS